MIRVPSFGTAGSGYDSSYTRDMTNNLTVTFRSIQAALNTINTALSALVSKAGDTMTGNFTIQKNSPVINLSTLTAVYTWQVRTNSSDVVDGGFYITRGTDYTNVGLRIDSSLRVGLGTGTSNINANSVLELRSTTRGFLMPRMTTAQRDAISLGSGDAGLEVYNTSTNKKNFWNGSAWEVVTSV